MKTLTLALIFIHLTLNFPSVIDAQTISAQTTEGSLCNNRLTDLSGYIYSDRSYYPRCNWTIEVPYGTVELYFNHVFMQNDGAYCDNDYVIIYDGYPWNSIELEKICYYTSQRFYSSSNAMTLEFYSPYYTGFFDAYYQSSSLSTTVPTTPAPCETRLTDLSGSIHGPQFYDRWCTWIIKVPYGNVELYFNYIYLTSYGAHCDADYVIIYDGYRWNSVVLGKICEYTSQRFYSSSNVMTLEIVNPNSYTYFNAYYQSSSLSTTEYTTPESTTTTATTTTHPVLHPAKPYKYPGGYSGYGGDSGYVPDSSYGNPNVPPVNPYQPPAHPNPNPAVASSYVNPNLSPVNPNLSQGKMENIICCILPYWNMCNLHNSQNNLCQSVKPSGGALGNQNNIYIFNTKTFGINDGG